MIMIPHLRERTSGWTAAAGNVGANTSISTTAGLDIGISRGQEELIPAFMNSWVKIGSLKSPKRAIVSSINFVE